MALYCTTPRLEAALADGPNAAPCTGCRDLVFAPGWWCDDCAACAFPLLLLDPDFEADDYT